VAPQIKDLCVKRSPWGIVCFWRVLGRYHLDDETKIKLDGCVKLAEYWAKRLDARRQFEWKITLAWWTLIILGVHHIHSESFRNLAHCEYVAYSIAAASALEVFFVRFWLYPLWRANARDKEKSLVAARGARGYCEGRASSLKKKPLKRSMCHSEPSQKIGRCNFKRSRRYCSLQFCAFPRAISRKLHSSLTG
jgi:hypothetical protein